MGCPTSRAEIKPFEPDTDNADAGKKLKISHCNILLTAENFGIKIYCNDKI